MATVTRTQVTTVDQVTAVAHNITGVTIPAGKLAVVRFGYQSDTVTISSVTDNAGNTWSVAVSVHSGTGDTQTSAIAFLVVPAAGLSGATVTITLSATATLAGHVAYFDSDTGWPSQANVLDKTSALNTGLVTSWTSNATATTTQADELLVGVAYAGGAINGGTSTASGSWTEENEQVLTNSGYELVTEWQKVTATGAYAATGTWSLAEIAACCIATFKTGTAAGGASFSPLLRMLNQRGRLRSLALLLIQRKPAPVPVGGLITVTVNQVSETDLAQALVSLKLKLLAAPLETDLAQALSARKTRLLGQPSETDLAQALATGRKLKLLGQASETDTAQTISRLLAGIGQASETDLAQPLSVRKTKTVGQASETDVAQPVRRVIAQASESDFAFGVARIKSRLLVQPSETDLAQPILRHKTKLLGQASESELAQPIIAHGGAVAAVSRERTRVSAGL